MMGLARVNLGFHLGWVPVGESKSFPIPAVQDPLPSNYMSILSFTWPREAAYS